MILLNFLEDTCDVSILLVTWNLPKSNLTTILSFSTGGCIASDAIGMCRFNFLK